MKKRGRPKKKTKKSAKAAEKENLKLKLDADIESIKATSSIIIFAFAFVFFLAAFGVAGKFGNFAYSKLYTLFGLGYFLVPLSLLLTSAAIYKSKKRSFGPVKSISSLIFFLSSLALLELLFNGYGGALGRAIASPVQYAFDTIAGAIILFAFLFASLILLFDSHPANVFAKLKSLLYERDEEDDAKERVEKAEKSAVEASVIKEAVKESKEKLSASKEAIKESAETIKESAGKIKNLVKKFDTEKDGELAMDTEQKSSESYKLPPLKLLKGDRGKPSTDDIRAKASVIKRTLTNFNIPVELDEITIGPTVTRYAVKPAEGVRLTKITSLQKELELALAASPIRIEAPIPGLPLVGIEVPNKNKPVLGLGKMLSSKQFQESKALLPIALGRDITGASHFTDLAKAPHMLIAGATGAGKSVTIHNIIISLLYKLPPDKLRFVMVDPKRVELTLYNGIPHLLRSVITSAKDTILAMKWLIQEMERRYDILEMHGIQNLKDYHSKVLPKLQKKYEAAIAKGEPAQEPQKLPFIVAVIDELADIMQTYPKELEASIVRIAQKARAVGIHLILATQRPDVRTITGLIKANIPTRLALQVPSSIDSRTILDQAGAEKLLGQGDMLFVNSSTPKPKRLQAAFVSEEEIKSVVRFIKSSFDGDLLDEMDFEELGASNAFFASGSLTSDDDERDSEEYKMARQLVVENGQASTSFLQRKLRIGYNKASRFMDMLEEEGIVGPPNGAKPREVLVKSLEELESAGQASARKIPDVADGYIDVEIDANEDESEDIENYDEDAQVNDATEENAEVEIKKDA